MASPPIFIVGTPRSGTTLTARILGGHSRIFMPAETHFFDDIYSRRKQLGDPRDPRSAERIIARLTTLYKRQHEGQYQKQHRDLFADPERLARLMGPCADYRDVLTRFIAIQMDLAGKARWGNHVPRDLFNIAEILSFYPDARIVVCVRDVRDFLVSYRGMRDVVPAKHVDRHRKLYHPVVTSLLWRASVRRIPEVRRRVAAANLLVLRYEDLVGAPEAAARRLCALIAEDFEPAMLDVPDNNSSDGERRAGTTGIFDSSVGRWRACLPKEHAYLGQVIAGSALDELGYLRERIDVNPVRLALIGSETPIALWRGLRANRKKQGAPALYLAKRLGALMGGGRDPGDGKPQTLPTFAEPRSREPEGSRR
jgi:hypothetical protein